jgi:hypothetical protein
MSNEGVLGKWHFGGEHAHTPDHPPVLLSGNKKSGSGAFAAGLLLARDASGELIPYAGAGTLVGVCDSPADEEAESCVYLAHGTVKARLLTKEGGSALAAADILALNVLTIYPL